METLEKHFKTLTGASFARRGAAIGDVISQWPAIAGERLASISEPANIRWPKTTGTETTGGTLFIRSRPGHALELQHEAPLLMERINSFLGYRAVAALKITPDHRPLRPDKHPRPRSLPPATAEVLERKLADIGDDKLKEALKRLGAGALGKAGSPQPK